jgi:hypothetical protein
MASTYSALKIELIATGEQSGTWGITTNNNLGNDALGEAITGSADVAFSSADVTVTLTDTNASQAARNLRLNLTGTTGGARSLILGSGCQIEKLYLVNNTCADAITVKNTSGSGIAVPAGKTMFVYNNGTNVVDAVTYIAGFATSGANSDITSLSGLATPLSIAQGGTGSASTTYVNLASNVTGTLPVGNGGTGATTLTGVLKGTGTTAFQAATAGTDYVAPGTATTFSANQTFGSGYLKLSGASSGTSTLNAASVAGTTTMTLPGTTSTLGYLNLPAVGTKTASYTLAVGDVGKYVQVGTSGAIVIPDATFAEGDAISIFNNTTGNITITCTITTAYIAGTDADKATVSLATRGVCTILFISGTVCVITGNVS